jgi:uncharacterized repeat protein (TIGR03806 family)
MPPTVTADHHLPPHVSRARTQGVPGVAQASWVSRSVLLAAVAVGVVAGGLATRMIRQRFGSSSHRSGDAVRANPSPSPSASVLTPVVVPRRGRASYPKQLSEFGLFAGPLGDLQPADRVVEYQLNTPLFTDYAEKQRLVRLPEGTAAGYTADGPLDFPIGTVIAKTFYYPADLADVAGDRRIVETRILEHREDGWVGIPYLWNDEQTDAALALTGGEVAVAWVHTDGEPRENVHLVPNFNDCKRCHATPTMQPLGPKARNLNRDVAAGGPSGRLVNQLVAWSTNGVLAGMPEHAAVPRLADWDDSASGTVEERARAYLDVNCAHCHSEQGPARNSGLHLDVATADPYRLGVFKTPVAAGRGTGGRLYGIVPSKPQESILHYRVETTKAGEMMPEFGRSLVHVEGLALITEWIEGIESPE